MPAPATPAARVPNVLPDWWSFTFMGMQLATNTHLQAALLPLTYQHVFNPIETFKKILPVGYDKATDSITSSLRIEMAGFSGAQAYPIIIFMFLGCTLFARNSLRGQPKLQQRLMKIPILTGLFSDVWLYTLVLTKVPHEVLMQPSIWTPNIAGLIYGLPGATLLKLVWLFGIGRDVV